MEDSSISLNKFISSTGICSRREADRWIEAGRIKINKQVAQKGNRVFPGDQVFLDGKPLGEKPQFVYLAFHKPAGITTTTDRQDRDNIIDFLKFPKRIFPVGRLDKASTGLLLLTNDGDIVNAILREENRHEKEYIVTVDRSITPQFLHRMRAGVPVLGRKTNPCTVEQLGLNRFRIILTQGMNRQIRRMCTYLGYEVRTLKRIRIMHLELGNLPPGKWRYLSSEEKDKLFKAIGRK